MDASRQAKILQKKLEELQTNDGKRSSSTQHKRSRSQSPGFETQVQKKKKNKKSEKSVDPSKLEDPPAVEEPPKFEIIRPELPKASTGKKKKASK